MKLKNKDAWETSQRNNQDEYGKSINDFAERWANAIEVELAKGKKLESVVRNAYLEADPNEKTDGFMRARAVGILAAAWEHGDDLRKWYNTANGLPPETKGVVVTAHIIDLPSGGDN